MDLSIQTQTDPPSSPASLFGEWIQDASLHAAFREARPFPHVLIDQFLRPDIADQMEQCFPEKYDGWWRYHNPIEVKYANDNIARLPPVARAVFDALAAPAVVARMRQITGISDLVSDEYLHGAGLHMHPRGGRLMMHLDYEQHPRAPRMERRLNIILYLSKGWDPAWNGATELWDAGMARCVVKSQVVFNRALIFRTNDISWHGVPDIIRCPPGRRRQSLAFYYISPLSSAPSADKEGANQEGYRTKASFVQRPGDAPDPRMTALLAIRPHRRISEEDMTRIWPDWDSSDDPGGDADA